MIRENVAPHVCGRSTGPRGIHARGSRLEVRLRLLQLALADGKQCRSRRVDELFRAIARLDVCDADGEGVRRLREDRGFQLCDVRVDLLARVVRRGLERGLERRVAHKKIGM